MSLYYLRRALEWLFEAAWAGPGPLNEEVPLWRSRRLPRVIWMLSVRRPPFPPSCLVLSVLSCFLPFLDTPQGLCMCCYLCCAEPFNSTFGQTFFLKDTHSSFVPRKDPTCRKGQVCHVPTRLIFHLIKKNVIKQGSKSKLYFPRKEHSNRRLRIIYLLFFFSESPPISWR